MPEDLLAEDNSNYVASARRIALLIVAVGALSAQLANEESQRRAAADLYGYLEKVLVVGGAVAAGGIAAGGEEQSAPSLKTPTQWQFMLAAMASGAYRAVKIDFDGTGPAFRAAGDPRGACDVTASPFVASDGPEASDGREAKVALAVMRPSRWEDMREEALPFEQVFIVRFGGDCVPMWKEAAFLVAKLGPEADDLALVLDDRVYEKLEVVWFLYRVNAQMTLEDADRFARFGEFLTAAQLKRLDCYAYPFLKASHSTFLQDLLVRHANEAKGRGYGADEWRQAAGDMAEAVLDPTGLWGFRFERGIAVRVATLVVMALSFSFLYRVRRLNSARDLREEPWAPLLPWGPAEVVGAAVWALGTVLAVVAVGWASRVYEGGVIEVGAEVHARIADGMHIYWPERVWLTISHPATCGPAAVMVATLLLMLGWLRVFKVAWEARRRRSTR